MLQPSPPSSEASASGSARYSQASQCLFQPCLDRSWLSRTIVAAHAIALTAAILIVVKPLESIPVPQVRSLGSVLPGFYHAYSLNATTDGAAADSRKTTEPFLIPSRNNQ